MQHMVIRPRGARSDKGNKLFNDVISSAENVQFRMYRSIHARNTKILTNCAIIFDRYTSQLYREVTHKSLNKFHEKFKSTVSVKYFIYCSTKTTHFLDKTFIEQGVREISVRGSQFERGRNFFPLLSFGRFLILALVPAMQETYYL